LQLLIVRKMAEGYTIDFIRNSERILRLFADLLSIIFDCLLNCADNQDFVLLTSVLEGEKLLVENIFLVHRAIQLVTNLSPKKIRIMLCIQRRRIGFGNRNPLPQRLGLIALPKSDRDVRR
jgi:hypothetical protein